MRVLLPMLEGGHTVRLDDLFYRFALDAATDFLFGTSVGSLENSQAEFADAFAEVQRVQALIARVCHRHGRLAGACMLTFRSLFAGWTTE